MPNTFDFASAVERWSAIALERTRVIRCFDDVRLARPGRSVIYLLAAWSGTSASCLRLITEALARTDWPGLEFSVLDIDCVPDDFMLATFHNRPAGSGETLWIRDGIIVGAVRCYPHSEVAATFLRNTRDLLDFSAT